MEIGENTEITIQFAIEDQEGEVLNDIYEHTPFRFRFGEIPQCQYPGLEEGVRGLSPGDTRLFVVPAVEAFGERDPDLVERIKASELPEGAARVGNLVRKLSDDGSSSDPYTVTGFIGDWVYLDRNHAWAGKALHYTVKVLTVIKLPGGHPNVQPLRK